MQTLRVAEQFGILFLAPGLPSPLILLQVLFFWQALAATLQKALASAAAVEEASTCLLHLLPHWLCYAGCRTLCLANFGSLTIVDSSLCSSTQAGPTQAAAVMVQGRSWNCRSYLHPWYPWPCVRLLGRCCGGMAC